VILDDLDDPASCGGDDGQIGPECLEVDEAESFCPGGHDEQVCGCEQRCHPRRLHASVELDPLLDTQLHGQGLDPAFCLVLTRDVEMDFRQRVGQECQGAHQRVETLAVEVASREEEGGASFERSGTDGRWAIAHGQG